MVFKNRAKAVCACAVLLLAVASPGSADTVVRFQTVAGDFDVQLYDLATPITVPNFLNYVNSGRFADSFFHRLVPGFVLQAGGFTYDGAIAPVESFGTIDNEFHASRSNLRGTLAMAKVGAQYDGNNDLIPGTGPDSATSEFFINLGDNSANLDGQNGGFTVFAEVIGNGMAVVDALASVQTFPFSSPFGQMPLRNYTTDQFNDFANNPLGTDNFEMFDVGFLPGDVDANGSVGEDDLNMIITNWGQNGLDRTGGDLNGNGIVDGLDYTEVLTYWSTGSPPPEPTGIPEPATLGLLLLGGLALSRRRGLT